MDTWTSSRWYWWKGFKWASGTVYSVSNSLLGWSANSRITTVNEQSENLIINWVLLAFSKHILTCFSRDKSLKLRTNGQQKRTTCFATLLQNKFNSHVERFTTHESNRSCNKMWVLEHATSLLNSFCSNVAKQAARLCCPFYRTFKRGSLASESLISLWDFSCSSNGLWLKNKGTWTVLHKNE